MNLARSHLLRASLQPTHFPAIRLPPLLVSQALVPPRDFRTSSPPRSPARPPQHLPERRRHHRKPRRTRPPVARSCLATSLTATTGPKVVLGDRSARQGRRAAGHVHPALLVASQPRRRRRRIFSAGQASVVQCAASAAAPEVVGVVPPIAIVNSYHPSDLRTSQSRSHSQIERRAHSGRSM